MSAIHLPSNAINWGQPVNRSSPLNRGLASWYVGGSASGASWQDIAGRFIATAESTVQWRPAIRHGGSICGYFPGTTSFIDGSSSIPGMASATNFSLAFWANADSIASTRVAVSIATTVTTITNAFLVYPVDNASGGTRVRVYWGTGNVINITGSHGTGAYYHHAFTYDGTTLIAYLNGVQLTTATTTKNLPATTPGVYIGRWDTQRFIGYIDDVRLWNRALSADEVAQAYTDSRTGYQRTLNRLARTFAYSSGAAATSVPVFAHHYRMQGAA